MLKKKKEKTIPDGTYRIIKIGKEALFEFLYETVIDNQERFFDVDDGTKIITTFDMDWEKGEFICAAYNDTGKPLQRMLDSDLDTEKLLSALDNTTNTMYQDNRYIELTEEEIQRIQGES